MSTELFEVVPPAEALERMWPHVIPIQGTESLSTGDAVGRVVARDVVAPEPSPTFARSVMDGFAVHAAETYGASEGLPSHLRVTGEVPMGRAAEYPLEANSAQIIHTGGMLPATADAVVMIEHTQSVGTDAVEILRPVAPGENVVQPGEDVAPGDTVLSAGQILRPQDAGALAALGITQIEVRRRPRLAILATGDEVVPADGTPNPGEVRDVNSTALTALARRAGMDVDPCGIAPDDAAQLIAAVQAAFAASDALVVSAGSSVSTRDLTAEALGGLGDPGILTHGVAVKPGKPTIMGVAGGKPIFGLPGNPVSALVIFDLLVRPVLGRLAGATTSPAEASVRARLTRNIASVTGRVDYVQARLVERESELFAEPVFGKSNLIFTMVRANGMIRVPLDLAGLRAGSWVDVRTF